MLLTTATAWADTGDEADGVYYIGADGKLKNTATDGIEGNDTPTVIDENFVFPMTAGWYVVTGDFEFPALINTTGEVHLILADGKTMTITTGYGSAIDLGGDLTIYGQSLGTGKLIANGSQCGITSNTNAENLTINGGNVTATGGNDYGISVNNVTINGGNVTATGGYYGIYALNNVTISGGIVTATGGNGIGIYAQGGNITLGGGIVNASSYSGTVNLTCDYRNADGTTIISGSYSDSYLNAYYYNVTLYPDIPVSYIDEDGDPQTVKSEDYKILDGNPDGGANLDEGTYVIYSNITYTGTVTLDDNVILILADGCTMNVGTKEEPIYYGKGIDGGNDASLTIYGQTLGTGALNVYTTGSMNHGIYAKNLTINGGRITAKTYGQNAVAINANSVVTINGGTVSATATGTGSTGISSQEDCIFITGGTVTASGKVYGIQADDLVEIYGGTVSATGNKGINAGDGITLGWNKPTDRIYASSYDGDIYVPATDGHKLYNGSGFLTGTVSDLDLINGKTLRPAYDIRLQDNADNDDAITADYHDGVPQFVTLQGRTLWKDGAWNTLCLPFALTAEQIAANADFAGAEIRELSSASFDDGTLTLDFTPATGEGAVTGITAGVPCIIRWESGSSFTPTFSGVTIDATARNKACDLGGGKSITFTGTYNPVRYADENKSVLFLGDGNTLYYPDGKATTTIGACRAYFALSGLEAGDPTDPSAPGVRAFTLNFGEGEETGIQEITDPTPDPSPAWEGSCCAWYTLDGRKLSGKPTKSGVYVSGGRKVVVK